MYTSVRMSTDWRSANLAAEFFVASQMFRVGLGVTITLGNTKEVDLVALRPDGSSVTVDVKGLKNTTNWVVKRERRAADHFFILVSYRNHFSVPTAAPECFIIPSVQIDDVLSQWSGLPEVTCVPYASVKNSDFREAWPLLLAAGTA